MKLILSLLIFVALVDVIQPKSMDDSTIPFVPSFLQKAMFNGPVDILKQFIRTEFKKCVKNEKYKKNLIAIMESFLNEIGYDLIVAIVKHDSSKVRNRLEHLVNGAGMAFRGTPYHDKIKKLYRCAINILKPEDILKGGLQMNGTFEKFHICAKEGRGKEHDVEPVIKVIEICYQKNVKVIKPLANAAFRMVELVAKKSKKDD